LGTEVKEKVKKEEEMADKLGIWRIIFDRSSIAGLVIERSRGGGNY